MHRPKKYNVNCPLKSFIGDVGGPAAQFPNQIQRGRAGVHTLHSGDDLLFLQSFGFVDCPFFIQPSVACMQLEGQVNFKEVLKRT